MTFLEATQKYFGAGMPVGQDSQKLVWVVTMDGIWRDAFPHLAEMPTPELFYHFIVMLDAETGDYVGSGTRR